MGNAFRRPAAYWFLTHAYIAGIFRVDRYGRPSGGCARVCQVEAVSER
jgi:hypothetical protein